MIKYFLGVGALIFIILLMVWVFCLTTVPSGYVGIVTTFGRVTDVISPGLNILNPFSFVTKISLQIFSTNTQSSAASSDLQNVETTIKLNYSINPVSAQKLFTQVGTDRSYIEQSIIDPAMNETFKSVVAQFNAEDLINERAKVSEQIQSVLEKKLNRYFINIQSVNITDFQFSKEFDKAIEQKVIAQQNISTEQNNLQKIKIEAEQKIVQAQADAQVLNLKKSAVTPELIQLKQVENNSLAIQKWDGHLPNYTGNNIPFIMNK